MKNTNTQNLYGKIPPEIITPPHGARQFSPLLPGSDALEECIKGSLENLKMLAPFGTIERRYVLALALEALAPGSPLTIMAPNDKGGTRLKQELRQFGCDVIEESRRHHRICMCAKPDQVLNIKEALQEGAPHFVKTVGFWSQPGLFSWERLDTGSTLLIDHLPQLSGHGADLGCGFGYLARAALTSPNIEHLVLIDIDRRAIDCARRNIDDKRAAFLWADINATSPNLSNLDFIVINPPFHDTGIENRALGQDFILKSHAFLKIGGVCWLTANRHLPYENILTNLYTSVALKAENNGYKVYEAIK